MAEANAGGNRSQTTSTTGNKSDSKAIAAAVADGRAPGRLVETTNSLSASDFFTKFAPSDLASTSSLSLPDHLDHQGLPLRLIQGDASSVASGGWLEECLKLVEETSAKDYQSSEIKWSTSKKRKEMKLPDMKYIILVEDEGQLAGFSSFMITYEDGYEVLYIYEIHFKVPWQGKGLGKRLMNMAEGIGRNVGVSKVMLTVFKANAAAVGWYARLGYREDEFSPGPRRLRNGTVKEATYIILSKSLKG